MPAIVPCPPRRHAPPRARLPAMLLVVLLAACAETQAPPPPDFRPLSFDYLTKLRLTVAAIDIDTVMSQKDIPGGVHVEALAPIQPVDALRRMAQDRLIPASTTGHAMFVIDDASIVQLPDRYEGNLVAHLDITTSDGTKSGYAEARVTRTRTIVDQSPAATRASLYELVKQMMNDMNVEFEFQARRSLRDYLQGPEETAPAPAPVEQQTLTPIAPPAIAMPPPAEP